MNPEQELRLTLVKLLLEQDVPVSKISEQVKLLSELILDSVPQSPSSTGDRE